MLRIDKTKKALVPLHRKSMREAGYWERRDLQEMIRSNPEPFCQELGEKIWLVGSEVTPASFVHDRIDLLAIDRDGGAVVIEIKRDSHKLQLLQALSYAGMVAKWEPKRFIQELSRFNNEMPLEQAKEQLEEFLDEGDAETINRNQRVILIAEEFDYEVLVTAEWLTERFDVDVRCYRIALANEGDADFLTCTSAYPPPELTDIAIRRRRRKEIGLSVSHDWPEALKSIENEAVARFFSEEVAAGRSNNPKYKVLRFFIGGRRRFGMNAKRKYARAWQNSRFDGDIEFWKTRLGDRSLVTPVEAGRKLRFYLHDDSDFGKFKQAVASELASTQFHSGVEDEDEPEPTTE